MERPVHQTSGSGSAQDHQRLEFAKKARRMCRLINNAMRNAMRNLEPIITAGETSLILFNRPWSDDDARLLLESAETEQTMLQQMIQLTEMTTEVIEQDFPGLTSALAAEQERGDGATQVSGLQATAHNTGQHHRAGRCRYGIQRDGPALVSYWACCELSKIATGWRTIATQLLHKTNRRHWQILDTIRHGSHSERGTPPPGEGEENPSTPWAERDMRTCPSPVSSSSGASCWEGDTELE